MTGTADEGRTTSAWLQAGELAFLALYGIALLVALSWLFSNVRQVPTANRAMIVRMGRLDRVEGPGLLWAWPRPIEEVNLLPSDETVLERDIPDATFTRLAGESLTDALASLGNRVTGDAGVVKMDVKVFYTVVQPHDYVLQRETINDTIDRLAARSVVTICASRDLDAILVARPELLADQASLADARQRLRSDVASSINRSLAELQLRKAGLGIQVSRVDLVTGVHPETVDAFNSVLTAGQDALRDIANARSDAARRMQSATEEADRIVRLAQADASERLSGAQADTSEIFRLASTLKDRADPGLLTRIYRERIGSILRSADSVTLVNPKDDSRLIIKGAGP